METLNNRQIKYVYSLAASGRTVDAANYLLQASESDDRVTTIQQGNDVLLALFYSFLTQGKVNEAAILAWGEVVFTIRPKAVKRVWDVLCDPKESKILVIGAGSQGKTYTGAGWANIWWQIDPHYTTGKIISTTKGHATSGILAKFLNLHRQAAFPLPGTPVAGGIEISGDKSASVLAIALPEGDTGEGRLTGFHPIPRPTPHPLLGTHGRVFAEVDEADQVPEGLWKGLDNMLGNIDEVGSVKVVCFTNPRKRSNSFAYRAEPPGGWVELSDRVMAGEEIDTWISTEGWRVLRLDGKSSENVVQQRSVFPGFLTYKAYKDYERRGKQDASYLTYARALYPESVAEFTVMGSAIFEGTRGKFTFIDQVIPIASCDPAFADGGDDAFLTLGQYGTAIGFTPLGSDKAIEIPATKVIQSDQQIKLVKGKTEVMGKSIIDILRSFNVKPEWYIMDMTGNGRGLYDHICWQYGKCYGVEWGSAATEFKILDEDTVPADERFKGVKTEMYFATGQWIEHGYLKFLPSMSTFTTLRDQLTLTQWHYKGTLQEVETKTEFKLKNKGHSPGEADSMIMLPHLVRLQASARATGLPPHPSEKHSPFADDKISPADGQIPFLKT